MNYEPREPSPNSFKPFNAQQEIAQIYVTMEAMAAAIGRLSDTLQKVASTLESQSAMNDDLLKICQRLHADIQALKGSQP